MMLPGGRLFLNFAEHAVVAHGYAFVVHHCAHGLLVGFDLFVQGGAPGRIGRKFEGRLFEPVVELPDDGLEITYEAH